MKNVELAEQWRLISQDDFEMSKIALQKGKRLHAAVCAQQSIEKALKGLHVLHNRLTHTIWSVLQKRLRKQNALVKLNWLHFQL
jgi:HEPN domain-containing protein